jgi:hypothetical protein
MSKRLHIFTGAVFIAIASSTLAAQSSAPKLTLHRSSGATSVAAPDSARASRIIAAADTLAATGHARDAMRSLHSLASDQRAAGEYPAEALRRLANLQFGAGQELDAANTLDRLADAAQEFGDPTTRLHALFDAALVYQGLKMYDRVPERAREILPLLKSPAIDAKLRTDIAAQISGIKSA